VFFYHDGSEEWVLLTEAEVHRSFRKLLRKAGVTPESLQRAEALVEQLRPESPLRHRLSEELEELRKLCTASS
jgi:hypothetical protein